MAVKKLYRSRTDQVLGGVCGGLGDYFNIDPVLFRIIFVVLLVGACTGVLLYLIMWLIIPLERYNPYNYSDQKGTNS